VSCLFSSTFIFALQFMLKKRVATPLTLFMFISPHEALILWQLNSDPLSLIPHSVGKLAALAQALITLDSASSPELSGLSLSSL